MNICGLIMFTLSFTTHFHRSAAFTRSSQLFGRIMSKTLSSSEKETGHQSKQGQPQLTPEDEDLMKKLQNHQASAARLSMAEEVRTLIDRSLMYGVLSTNSVQLAGYPTGSVVGFELDEAGKPFFVFSTMSSHTKDISQDKRASLTVLASDFKGAAEGRVVIIGNVVQVTDQDRRSALREKYLSRHKDAYWIDFGDFSYFNMDNIELVRYVGGFAMAGSLTPEQYLGAKPDPIAAFAAPVMKHMNEDHSDSTIAMIKHYIGVDCSEAEIIGLDRLGMTVKAKLTLGEGGYAKLRLPFPREVAERKAVKEVLVEMTRASARASE